MRKTKNKSRKSETMGIKELVNRKYSDEEEARIAHFLARYERKPARLKKAEGGHPGVLSVKGQDSDKLLTAVKLMEALGTPDADLQQSLLNQVILTFGGVATSDGFRLDQVEALCNDALAILNGIQPRDEIEGLLAVQMIGVHNLAMETMKRAMITDQTFEGKETNVNQANKMLRTFTAQMEALKRYRSGGQQKVTVEHVHVNEGGQAIVGTVNQGGGGSGEKNRG
jgi:hypothetical protein